MKKYMDIDEQTKKDLLKANNIKESHMADVAVNNKLGLKFKSIQ